MGRSVLSSSGSEAQRGHQQHLQSYKVCLPCQTHQFSTLLRLYYTLWLLLLARISTQLHQEAPLMFAPRLGAIKHVSMLHALATYAASIVLQLAVAH